MPDPMYTRRRRGSARFDPYYKVQWFDETSLAWRDQQESHASVAAAQAAFIPGRRCRVMAVTERGRMPLA